jgi:hypothetical protein
MTIVVMSYTENDCKVTENPGKEIDTFINSFIQEIRTITDKYDA